MSLVEKAKENTQRITITQEHEELAMAWTKDEVSLTGAEKALYGKTGGMRVYVLFARTLKKMICEGKLVEVGKLVEISGKEITK